MQFQPQISLDKDKFVDMKISKDQTLRYTYTFEYPFNYEILTFCRALKDKVGYKNFGFEKGKWRFNRLQYVASIQKMYSDIEIDQRVQNDIKDFVKQQKEIKLQTERAEQIKDSLDSNIKLDDIKGELYPYQKVGAEFFVNSNGKAILADVMGLGKTVQALAYIVHQKHKKSLVICPASVKFVWEDEINKWTDLKSLVIGPKSVLTPDTIDKYDVFIINYDLLKRFLKFIFIKWDCVICDEFHYIKNIKAQRTKFVKALAKKAKSILLLSGTPFLNRPVELFNGLNLMDPAVWNDWFIYTKRYCNGHQTRWGWDSKGATNIDELQKKISRYFLRRTKDEVLKDLPQKRFITYPVELEKKFSDEYRMAQTSFKEYLRDVKKKDDVDARSIQASKLVKLNELRQISSNGKVWALKEIAQSILDAGEKTVIFSAYNHPLEELKKYFEDEAVLLTGKTKAEDRKEIVEKFQTDDNVKIFLGGIKSGGVGITLTAASNVIFLDFSWTPADHLQAIDRIHRIGQTAKHITVYQLVCKGTIDEYITKTLGKKQEIFNQLIEGGTAQVDIIGTVLKFLEK